MTGEMVPGQRSNKDIQGGREDDMFLSIFYARMYKHIRKGKRMNDRTYLAADIIITRYFPEGSTDFMFGAMSLPNTNDCVVGACSQNECTDIYISHYGHPATEVWLKNFTLWIGARSDVKSCKITGAYNPWLDEESDRNATAELKAAPEGGCSFERIEADKAL